MNNKELQIMSWLLLVNGIVIGTMAEWYLDMVGYHLWGKLAFGLSLAISYFLAICIVEFKKREKGE